MEVASNQTTYLKTEVEKVSMSTANGYGLVGSKGGERSSCCLKEEEANILLLRRALLVATRRHFASLLVRLLSVFFAG